MKLKSHSGTKKRIRKTGKNKLMMQKSCKRHLLMNKSKRQKKVSTKGLELDASNVKKVKRLLPNL